MSHNRHVLRPEVAAELERLRPETLPLTLRIRLDRHFTELYDPYVRLYGGTSGLRAVMDAVTAADAARPEALRIADHEREITPDWFQREQTIGYVLYVDRFAGSLRGVREKLPYLQELGVNYVHLMPILHARPAPNDGGYAVMDYGAVDPALGTMEDLRTLADALRDAGMSLCVDLVVNHTAREHAWARQAMEGDAAMLARYRAFPDRELPDAYERTLPEVFPDVAPGSFSWVPELRRWVWTTFHDYQWDLDWSNPEVFAEMAANVLHLANQGVDVLRLDAVPFLWKRMGTDCQNQPEVHDVLQALRAVVRMAAPAVAFKAEAIVSPHQLVPYLGTDRHEGRECDLAYHNSLMVLLWSALASGKATLMTQTLRAMPPAPAAAAWIQYVRGHDDIGWAITEEDAAAAGEDGHLHRRFLAEFYAGDFPGSFARGAYFQRDTATGEARTSGTAASLAGLEAALAAGDADGAELAVRRLLLLHSVTFSYGGVPVVYMGDELGLRNDHAYVDEPAHAMDNRWLHRPVMDWEAAARRHDRASVEGRMWAGLRRLVDARRATRAVHAAGSAEPVWSGNQHVFAYVRRFAGEALLCVCNVSGWDQHVGQALLDEHGFGQASADGGPDDRPVHRTDAGLVLAPYQFAWLRA